ncbi:MAG TPA: GNAT family N-acetyltransferase [Acidimicrobiales bacterium]|nr:GNAT family N-acetyltransferase [Acidimicrobiales bacterium]
MGSTPEIVEGPLRGPVLDQATDVAVRAFDDDPFFGYLFPRADRRHRSVARLHRAVMIHLADIAVTSSAVLDGKVVGVAMWVGPGSWPYPPTVQLRQLLGALHAFLPDVGALSRAGRILRAVESAHPKIPQWYLQLLMVDPDVQRQGIGGRLQASTLERCDREGLPAWVETQKEENLAYYGRFGFEVVHEHPIAAGPSMWSLRREPKGT